MFNLSCFSRSKLQPSSVTSTTQDLKVNLESVENSRLFRSVWLCNEKFSKTLLPVMDQLVENERLNNHNRTNSFLPHVTLFSGEHLSTGDCQKVVDLFVEHFPDGLRLMVSEFKKNPYVNPPVQLIFQLHPEEDHKQFSLLQNTVKDKLGLNISVNNRWLHSTLIYKNVAQPLHAGSVTLAQRMAESLIGTEIIFDEYAITTGRAWNPSDIAGWAELKAQPLIKDHKNMISECTL